MAVQATAQWWVRTDGDNTNGGGYDSGISGAGTNYSDQASAQLSLTDLATASAGSTTLTSATGGFTAAMIGNAIQIVSGTNANAGFYFITGYTDANTVTIDRACDNGSGGLSGGSGKLGGAVAGLEKFSINSSHNPNSPLVAKNQINVRGTGNEDSATVDYQLPSAYLQFVNAGYNHILIKGYNGRPHYKSTSGIHLFCWQINGIDFENMKISSGGSSVSNHMVTSQNYYSTLKNCILESEYLEIMSTGCNLFRCVIRHVGITGSPSSNPIVNLPDFGGFADGCLFDSLRGAIQVNRGVYFSNNIIANSNASRAVYLTSNNYSSHISRNIIYGSAGNGIDVSAQTQANRTVFENVIVNSAGYGIVANSSAKLDHFLDYNYFYNNTSGNYNGYSGGDNDITLTADPFVDAANGDFNLNADAGGGATLRSTNYTLGG